MYNLIAFLFLPYFRLELPGWGYLYKIIGLGNNSLWKTPIIKTIRNKYTNYLIRLNLANWSERHIYFLGRFYDLKLQLLMSKILKPGERFVDIGANIGMITLHGASLVTDSGLIDSFEPNPECYKRIDESLKLNNIQQVNIHKLGLSDKPETLLLSVVTEHSGMGTLTEIQDDQRDLVSKTFEVQVVTGDEVIMQNSLPVMLIKIDVEGFELRVLKGLKKSLTTWHPIVITEVVKQWLNRAGNSRTEIFHFMNQFGYSPYGLTIRKKFLIYDIALIPLRGSDVENVNFTDDFLWLHPESLANEVLQGYIVL